MLFKIVEYLVRLLKYVIKLCDIALTLVKHAIPVAAVSSAFGYYIGKLVHHYHFQATTNECMAIATLTGLAVYLLVVFIVLLVRFVKEES